MSKLRKAAVTKRTNFRESVGEQYGEMEKKGYLMKKGSGFGGSWQKRYFVASGHYLKYYKNETENHNGKTPLAAIDLRKVEIGTEVDHADQIEIVIGGGDHVRLKADSRSEANSWKDKISELKQLDAEMMSKIAETTWEGNDETISRDEPASSRADADLYEVEFPDQGLGIEVRDGDVPGVVVIAKVNAPEYQDRIAVGDILFSFNGITVAEHEISSKDDVAKIVSTLGRPLTMGFKRGDAVIDAPVPENEDPNEEAAAAEPEPVPEPVPNTENVSPGVTQEASTSSINGDKKPGRRTSLLQKQQAAIALSSEKSPSPAASEPTPVEPPEPTAVVETPVETPTVMPVPTANGTAQIQVPAPALDGPDREQLEFEFTEDKLSMSFRLREGRVQIAIVKPKGAAEKRGLLVDDVILEVNKEPAPIDLDVMQDLLASSARPLRLLISRVKQVAVETPAITSKSGPLRKQGHLYPSWKTRFFVMAANPEPVLMYYTDQTKTIMKGSINLRNATVIPDKPGELQTQGYQFAIKEASGKLYPIEAMTAKERTDWVAALTSVINPPPKRTRGV